MADPIVIGFNLNFLRVPFLPRLKPPPLWESWFSSGYFELLHVQIGQGVPKLQGFKADHPHTSGPKPSCQH